MTESRRERWTRRAVSAPPALFLSVFFAAPALIVLLASFREPGEFGGLAPLPQLTLESYRFLGADGIYLEVLAKSLLVATATTLICLFAGYPLAWLIARSPARIRDALLLLVVLPLASNFLVRIYAWMLLLGPMNLLYTPVAVVLAMVYVHLPFMVLPLATRLETQDRSLLEAARDLGAGPWTRFWRIILPLSVPGICAGSVLVFIPVLGMFAIPELLGGTGDLLIGNLIKEQFLDNRDWPLGSALSLALTVAVLAVTGLASLAARRWEGIS